MLRYVLGLLATCTLFSACLRASEMKGKITDPSGAPVAGAEVALVNRVGVLARATAATQRNFRLDVPENSDARIVVSAPGFSYPHSAARRVRPASNSKSRLRWIPIQVVGSTIEIPATAAELERRRNHRQPGPPAQ